MMGNRTKAVARPGLAPTNPCSFCKAECCKTYFITVTAFDVLRAMERTGRPYDEFATLHQARLLAFDPDTTMDMAGDSWAYLLGFRSHPCVFLDKSDHCTIYDSAPLSCKRYPFQLNGRRNTGFCPLPSKLIFRLKNADIGAEQMAGELEAHKKLVKEWNRSPGRKNECVGFLVEKARNIMQSAP